jgi:threonine dehydrogenase-like Zn-dependent dehydrogenase
MKAIRFADELTIEDIPQPEPGEGEALIRMELAGICRTDLEIVEGYMGFTGTLGHEFVGTVVESPSDEELIGNRVVGDINLAPWVEDSVQQRHDPDRTVLGILGKDGCFAEYLTLPLENLHLVPDAVTDEQAVFVEPLAAACEILEQVHIQPTDHVAVLGDGRLGLLCAQVLSLASSATVLIGKHRTKLELAAKNSVRTLNRHELTEADHSNFDVVVDCTGQPEGLEAALNLVRPRGTIVMKTTTAVSPKVHFAQVVIDEITLVGSRCGQFQPALDLLRRGLVSVDDMIDAEYSLKDGLQAFEHAARPGMLKVTLKNDPS